MARHLAEIFGTEKDRVNCPFYFKIGACRFGERCSRIHNKPPISQTLLLAHMYHGPSSSLADYNPVEGGNEAREVTERQNQKHFEDFYEDVYTELSSFGRIEELNVVDNIGPHLVRTLVFFKPPFNKLNYSNLNSIIIIN